MAKRNKSKLEKSTIGGEISKAKKNASTKLPSFSSPIGQRKDYQVEWGFLQSDLKGLSSDDKRKELTKFYKRIAKVADQRLVNLESLMKKQGYKDVGEWAYAIAMRNIRSEWGSEAKRFNRKPPENINSIYKNINRVLDFLNSPTSSKQGIDKVYQKRADTIKSKYGVDMSWSKTATVFDSVLWKKRGTRFGSGTVLKAIGVLQANKQKIRDSLGDKPITVIVPGDEEARKAALKKGHSVIESDLKDDNIVNEINKQLRYYKKDVKSLLNIK